MTDATKTPPQSDRPDLTNPATYQISDPQEFTRNMMRLVEESARAMNAMMSHSPEQAGPMSSTHELAAASKTMTEIAQRWMANPARLVEVQTDLMQRLQAILDRRSPPLPR